MNIGNITFDFTNASVGSIPVGTTLADSWKNKECVNFTNEALVNQSIDDNFKFMIPAICLLIGFIVYYIGTYKNNEKLEIIGLRVVFFSGQAFVLAMLFKFFVYWVLGVGVPYYE